MESRMTKLSKEEQQQLARLKATHYCEDRVYDLSLQYYSEYKSKADQFSLDKTAIALKCALFMAQKSTFSLNVKGEKMRGVSLSLGSLLKSHKLDDIMIMLKDFSKKVTITDKQAASDLGNIIKEISFLITFHKKFEKIIEKLQLRERFPESAGGDQIKIFSSFVWLLYVEAKNKILKKSLELIQNTCMLAHSIAFMLYYSWDYMYPAALLKGGSLADPQRKVNLSQNSSHKDFSLVSKQAILQMFLIRNLDMYNNIAKSFENFFNDLCDKHYIKNSQNKTDFLSPQLINPNYRKMDKTYQKGLDGNDLDERIFFRERAANLTPSKFTPFAKQGQANKVIKAGTSKFGALNGNHSTVNKQTFSSHRILNYDLQDRQQTIQRVNPVNLAEMKLPKSVMQSPSMLKVPLICSTPITKGMEMYNYINEKARKSTTLLTNHSKKHDNVALALIQIIYEKTKKDSDKTKQIRSALIFSLYKIAAEDYLALHPSEVNSEDVHKALLAVALELVFFVSNINYNFEQIQSDLNSDTFSLWKATDFFLKFDRSIPATLKEHLLDIEVDLLSSKIWRDNNVVKLLDRFVNNERDKDQGRQQFTQKLFRRILHHTGFQTTQLCNSLKLEQSIVESVFDTLKFIIGQRLRLMVGRHIDQMVMCSIFANCKVEKISIKFTEIIENYKECNPNNKQEHERIIMEIAGQQQQDQNGALHDTTVDMIRFYNDYFMQEVREFLLGMRSRHNTSTNSNTTKRVHNTNASNLLQSPLKDIIPNDLNRLNRNKKIVNGKNTQTTNHSLLYAYNESPMLKNDSISFKHPIKSKKIINYEEQEAKALKDPQEAGVENMEMTKISPRNIQSQFNSKKFINLKPSSGAPSRQNNDGSINMPTPTRPNKNQPNPYELNQYSSHNPIRPTTNFTLNPLNAGNLPSYAKMQPSVAQYATGNAYKPGANGSKFDHRY